MSLNADNYYCSHFETPWGAGIVSANDLGITSVRLPGDTSLFSIQPASPLTEHAATLLQRYFSEGEQPFHLLAIDLSPLTPFQKRILEQTRLLAYGDISSYGALARLAGNPRGARGVGGALAANPIPIIIPCHRIVASNGALTGYSAPGGIDTKCWLLRHEGHLVSDGRIALKSASFAQG